MWEINELIGMGFSAAMCVQVDWKMISFQPVATAALREL